MPPSCRLRRRFGQLLRLGDSPHWGEASNAFQALRRVLTEAGLSYADVAVIVESHQGPVEELRYSDSDAKAIYERGREEGRKQAGGRLSPDFFDDDCNPRWLEMANFCRAQPGLNPKELDFLDDMPRHLRWRPPSASQGGFLFSIFWKMRRSLR